MNRLILLAALLFASPIFAQSVTMPAVVNVQPGRLAAVRIVLDGDDLKRDVPAELDCFREYSPDPKDVWLRAQGRTKGTYRLAAVTKGGSSPS
ncbi:hypothetical protein [Zavarzinella formosa]|uniref:hypothetical protein n=1 Tax=Zavarzinella formosa TaxID=360055 RepID=UPI0002DC8BB9|nr:hypothetical protein [Zavarzinella formosa]